MFLVSPVVRIQSHASPPGGPAFAKRPWRCGKGTWGGREISSSVTPGDGAVSGQGSFLPPFKVFTFVQLSGWAYLWPPKPGAVP